MFLEKKTYVTKVMKKKEFITCIVKKSKIKKMWTSIKVVKVEIKKVKLKICF